MIDKGIEYIYNLTEKKQPNMKTKRQKQMIKVKDQILKGEWFFIPTRMGGVITIKLRNGLFINQINQVVSVVSKITDTRVQWKMQVMDREVRGEFLHSSVTFMKDEERRMIDEMMDKKE